MPKNSTQLNAVQVTVTANGQPCDFDTLKLQQSMTDHHRFAIRVNYRPNKPSVWTVTPETIFKQLGTPLTIEMKHLATGETTEFAGIITHIDTGGKDGDQGYVVLSGGSPTLLLDMAPAMEAYCEATLPNIVSQVIEKCGATIEVQNKAKFDAIIPYAARYRESAFTFLARLAASCGEWLYYDGKKLVLGNPKIENDTKAVFDVQLKAVNIAARLGNLNTELYDYDPTENDYK
ncbi:MAG: hypothetical protein JXR39_01235, partial [Marinilabiliaceae bacterium]|nr:hypothetical protein [Marinilabiliaceae bacterium]